MNVLKSCLFTAGCLNLLGGQALAAVIPKDLIGVGSHLAFTRDIDFGRERSRTFCDGRPRAAWLPSVVHCCSVVRGSPTAFATRAVLKGQVPRTVNFVNYRRTKIMVDATSATYVRCRSHLISATYLTKAFGDAIEINQVVPPVSLPVGGVVEF